MRPNVNRMLIASSALLFASLGQAGEKYFINNTTDDSAAVELIPQDASASKVTVTVKHGERILIQYGGEFAKQISFKYQRDNRIMPAKVMWDKDGINRNTLFVMNADGVKMFPWSPSFWKGKVQKQKMLKGGAAGPDYFDNSMGTSGDAADSNMAGNAN